MGTDYENELWEDTSINSACAVCGVKALVGLSGTGRRLKFLCRACFDGRCRPITVRLCSVDGFSKTRKFKTLAGAQKFAQRYAGKGPELGGGYAISGDGVCRIMVDGAKLRDLFPDAL